MNVTDAADRILGDLEARAAMRVASALGKTRAGGERWAGFVFTKRGVRLLQCEHDHATANEAEGCARKLARWWARLEAARGVRW
jgi:hypothetical protein